MVQQTYVAAAPPQAGEPVAVVGMACRFPGGAHSPAALWDLLAQGVDAVVEVPIGRWDASAFYDPNMAAPGKMVSRWGGFLQDDVAAFDAAFFNLTRREAERMDPQHRLLLEVTWEALEHAGQPLERLRGSNTGVFVGMMNYNEYASVKDLAKVPEETTPYDSVADANSVAAGRVAYLLDVHGPCMTLDTASSSAAVATHLAVQSLRLGECDTALVGSVSLMLTAQHMVAFSKSGMMSRAGRCRGFDARGDGYVRAEGCGVLVLKRLRQAEASGDRILAVVRGTAINQDGRSPSLTAPSGPAQEAVLRAALANAGATAAEVDVVEAHGSGTPVGDPIEMHALQNVLGERAGGPPLIVGSIKTNLGHMEAVAGMAGLMKMILALQHGAIPAHLHFETLNPAIRLDAQRVRVAQTLTPWPITPGRPRVGGVSSFGFSGTNVHMLLQEAPPRPDTAPASGPTERLLTLSARSPEALRAYVGSLLRAWPTAPLAQVAATAALRRTHYEHRLTVVGDTAEAWQNALTAWLAGAPGSTAAQHAVVAPPHARPVFVFPGQGGQWLGMARGLLRDEPVFAEALGACDAALGQHTGWSVLTELQADHARARLDQVDVIQPTLFAVQVALATLLQAWGVRPAAVVGHSMGELAAACIAGVLSLNDAAKAMVCRSRLMRSASGRGGLVAVDLSPEAAEAMLTGLEGNLCVAVRNGPSSCAIAGDVAAVQALHAQLQNRGIFAALVKVDVAAHSSHMQPLVAPLVEALAGLQPRPAAVPMWSTVTGAPLGEGDATAAYWGRNLREPVRFDAAMQALLNADFRTFVEISPHPVLTPVITPAVRSLDDGAAVPTLRRDAPERATLLHALGQLHCRGVPVDLAAVTPQAPPTDLPSYAWQRERCWVTPPARRPDNQSPSPADPLMPLLSHRWVPLPPAAEVPVTDRGRDVWMLCGSQGCGFTAALAQALTAHGAQVVQIADDADLSAALAHHHAAAFRCRGVVHLRSLKALDLGRDGEPFARAMDAGCASVVRTVKAVLQQAWRQPPWLVLITAQAQAVQPDDLVAPQQSPVWGLGRTLMYEHPGLRCSRVDVAPTDALAVRTQADALAAALVTSTPEDELALRPGGLRFAGRFTMPPSLPPRRADAATSLRPDATYVITGSPTLGWQVAQALVAKGARHLLLVGPAGRNSLGGGAFSPQDLGVHVELAQADLSQYAAVAGVLAHAAAHLPPVRGIVHAADVADAAPAVEYTAERLTRALGRKALGAWHLHTLTLTLSLDFFVLYSATAGLLGTPGQAALAAACAFLDSLAELRRRQGLPALSIAWAPFTEANDNAAIPAQAAQAGMGLFTPADSARLLQNLMFCDAARVGVAPLDARQWLEFHPGVAGSSLFAELRSARGNAVVAAPTAVRAQLEAAPPEQRLARLETFLRHQIAVVLRTEPQRIGTHTPLKELGVESLTGVELRNQLEADLGVQLSATLTWSHPTVTALVAFFADLLHLTAPAPTPAASSIASTSAASARHSGWFFPEPSAEALAAMTPDELIAALEQEL